ncbi:MAG: hypothetical protein ACJ8GO_06525 [Ramlibacter sp.]
MRPARPWILLLACAAWPLAHAQAIYRCGDSYSQQPCAGATQLTPGAPAPSAAERSQAAALATRDARLADSLERDRVRREAQAGPASVVLPAAPVAELEPHKWPDKAGTRKLDVFTASVPGSKQAKAKTAAKAKAEPKDQGKKASTAKTVKTAKAAAG